MPDFFKIPIDQAKKAYEETASPSLTDQLLAAILAQLEKISHQLEKPHDTE